MSAINRHRCALFIASALVASLALASCAKDPSAPNSAAPNSAARNPAARSPAAPNPAAPNPAAAATPRDAVPTSTTVAARTAAAWSFVMGGTPGPLVIDGDLVIAASGTRVTALDIVSGSRRWTAHLPEPGERMYGPAIGPDFVVVEGGGLVHVFDSDNGADRWTSTTTYRGQPIVAGPAGHELVIGSDAIEGRLGAFDPRDGTPRWTVAVPRAFMIGSPVYVPNAASVVAVWEAPNGQGMLRSFDIETGALRWEQPLARGESPPGVAGPDVVVVGEGAGDGTGIILAVDARTGVMRWRTPVPDAFWARSGPVTDGATIAIVDQNGSLALLDRVDGHVRGRAETGAPPTVNPALDADRVAVASEGGDLVVVNRKDGRLLRHDTVRRVVAGLVVTGGSVLVSTALDDHPGVESRPLP